MKKFCGRCKKELQVDSKYLLCAECHLKVVKQENDTSYYENSRVRY